MKGPRIITARSIGLSFRMSQLGAMRSEETVVGHYSGENTTRARNLDEGIDRARSFHRYHQVTRGWAGIGYHYLIPDSGEIVCCRPVIYKGAHCLADNAGRVGVVMPGNGPDRPTRAQARSFNWLLHQAHTGALPRPHRTTRNLSDLPRYGHRTVPGQKTECPGLFLAMYLRGGDPWDDTFARAEEELDGFVELGPDEVPAESPEKLDVLATGPDADEAEANYDADDEGELPEADDAFEENLATALRQAP